MKTANYHISLDIQDSHSGALLEMKQHDTGRRITITLTDGGRPYEIAGDCYGVFTAKKPDGTAIFNDCQIVGNTLIYDVTAQTTASAGELACEIRLYGGDDKLLTCAAFGILVYPTVVSDDDVTASMPEATTLTRLLDRVERVEDFMDDSVLADKAWSAKRMVDALCPAFTKTGAVVACEPVAGYPLEVISQAPDTAQEVAITHCGKNLFDFKQSVAELNIASSAGGITTRFGHAIRLPAGTYTIHVENAQAANRYIYGAVNTKDGSFKATCNLVILESIHKRTVTIDEGDVIYIYNGVVGSSPTGTEFVFEQFDIQIETGSVATAYAPYHGEVVEPGTVTAWAGENTFFAETGEVTVTGRRDIISILEGIENGN